MSLSQIERVRPSSGQSSELPVLVLIHGRGDKPENFIHLTDELVCPRRELALRAPHELDFGFDRGWQWFETLSGQGDSDALAMDINFACTSIAEYLEALNQKEGCPNRKFVICGFSQGGMLTYALALRYPKLVSSAFSIAGLLPAASRPALDQMEDKPFIVAFHGLADPSVCSKRAMELVAWLEEHQYPVSFKGYPGVEHTVSLEMHRDLLRGLEEALSVRGFGESR